MQIAKRFPGSGLRAARSVEASPGRAKANGAPQLLRRFHQPPDGGEDNFEFPVTILLDLVQAGGQFVVSGEHFPQFHKGAHDGDIAFDGPLAAEPGGKHRHVPASLFEVFFSRFPSIQQADD